MFKNVMMFLFTVGVLLVGLTFWKIYSSSRVENRAHAFCDLLVNGADISVIDNSITLSPPETVREFSPTENIDWSTNISEFSAADVKQMQGQLWFEFRNGPSLSQCRVTLANGKITRTSIFSLP